MLALGTAEALPLNIEAIPDAARHLDSPYLLHTPAWLLFVLASLGSDSTFRLQLSLLRQVMSCIQADGRAGLTSDDSEPAIYTTFNVYSACKAFADRFGGDQLLDVFIERPEVLETMDKGVRSDRSMVFVGSSVEGLGVARALQANFERDTFDAVLWEQSVFDPSATAIESLERVCAEADFAVLVLTPDDTVSSRGDAHPAMRDNVLFELGLFIGALGRNRVFIVQPRASMKKPSDLLGITTIDYDPVRMASAPRAALGPASDAVRRRISELGRR